MENVACLSMHNYYFPSYILESLRDKNYIFIKHCIKKSQYYYVVYDVYSTLNVASQQINVSPQCVRLSEKLQLNCSTLQ